MQLILKDVQRDEARWHIGYKPFSPVRIEAGKGYCVLIRMVHLVDVLVQPSSVKNTMTPVEAEILYEDDDQKLYGMRETY